MRAPAFWMAVLLLAPLAAGAGDSAKSSRSTDRVDILVAAHDLPAGHKVTPDDLLQMHVASKWVTASQIKADAASYILGQPLSLPVLEGGTLTWQMFAITVGRETLDACARVVHQPKSAKEQIAAARQAVLRH